MGTFVLPDLGEGLAEVEILAWHVKPGDRVLADQPMVSVETAKAVVEVPVPFSGTVLALHGAVGDIVATGAPLVEFDSGTVVGRMPTSSEEAWVEPAVPPRARHDAARQRALPVARALARRLALDLSTIEGSGAEGLIRLDDVLAHARIGAPGPVPGLGLPAGLTAGMTAEPLRGARRAMAQSMSLSRDQVAGSTVCDDADLHGWSTRGDYMLRLIRALIAGCNAEPALNAWYDSASDSRYVLERIDLAIAVDTAGGLIVPVLRDVRAKTPEELRTATAAHKDAAHRRAIAPAELRDFTLLLSNFGTLAGRYGIPLVVPPAVAILGAGKVREDAVVVAGAVVAHRRMPLSLSFDHRCVTGGEACRFLAAVIADLEKPN
jgi:pyruvate dehydrogenase E2 component (dihydrolipoamide acetyltransferase)